MRTARLWALTGAVGLAISGVAAAAWPSPTPSHTSAQRASLHGSLTPAVERSHHAGSVPTNAAVSFDLLLALRNASGAQAFVRQVSSPGTAEFHHYLTDATWNARYAPTAAEIAKAKSWLRSEGFSIGALPKDRLFIPASGSAALVEKAFGVSLGYYKVNGHTVRLANGTLSIPVSLAGVVSGAVGVNQYVATPDLSTVSTAAAAAKPKPTQEPPPPAGYRNPPVCSQYWGQLIDTTDSSQLYAPYTSPLPYDVCGYVPTQLRDAYGIGSQVAAGTDGTGVTVAIVDAYDSPTLFSDAHKYFQLNDPSHPLTAAQFTNLTPSSIDDVSLCDGSGWYPEQALDVESVHTMAPGANILYVGAQDCVNGLLTALTTAVTSGASVVTDSWGDDIGDLLDDASYKTAFDDTFMLAAATGVSVLFSSGDEGDNFGAFGLGAPDYPAVSPFVTAVGGTTLEVNQDNQRAAEYGWSTADEVLCSPDNSTNCGSATSPSGTLAWFYGGGGGTSYYYTQPYYQASVVPSELALRNEPLFGPIPARVIPDVSMDADPQSGMLIGLTQTFPNGTYYSQFKEGGTSLASPLLAGVIADADQAAGIPLGFLNPVLYKASTVKGTFNDILPPSNPNATAAIRVDYADGIDSSQGYVVHLRAIDYEGPETYCDGTNNCATRPVMLTAAPGFDSITGLGSVGWNFICELEKF